MKEMQLEDFVGQGFLSGVDFYSEENEDSWSDVASVCRFTWNGETYLAKEDPCDGYRSCMDKIVSSRVNTKNPFKKIKVIGVMDTNVSNNLLTFYCIKNAKPVLTIGTENSDDYYPSFVAHFQPENIEN